MPFQPQPLLTLGFTVGIVHRQPLLQTATRVAWRPGSDLDQQISIISEPFLTDDSAEQAGVVDRQQPSAIFSATIGAAANVSAKRT